VRYALAVEVKLVEIPEEPEPLPIPTIGSDPMAGITALANRVIAIPSQHPMGYTPPAGFDFRKQIIVSAMNFSALTTIVEKFDNLIHDIEFSGVEES
jgi:hypothetical protein